MENSKLISYLKTFSDTEMKEFGKYLEGQSQRKPSGAVVGLYKYLKKWHPEFPSKKIDREEVKKKIFAGVKNSERRLADTMYHLVISIENFLVKKKFDERPTQWNLMLLEAQKERKLDKLFFQKINAIEKEWDKEPVPGIGHLHNQYLLKQMCFLHPNYSVFNESELKIDHLALELDQYYFALKIYWELCDNLTKVDSLSETSPQHLIENILALCNTSEFINNERLQFLVKILEVLNDQSFENYLLVKTLFFDNTNIFNDYEKTDILNGLNIICYASHRKGEPNVLKELFLLNKFALENNLWLEDGNINVIRFQSIVNIACGVGELLWTEKFIEEYSSKIKEDDRDEMTTLCKANLAFYQNDLNGALQKIAGMKFKNAHYGLQARFIQLQCYYELEEYQDLFYNLVRSFSTFLKRNQDFSEYLKNASMNFIRYSNILKKKADQKLSVNQSLYNEINGESTLVCKSWLIQKLNELEIDKS